MEYNWNIKQIKNYKKKIKYLLRTTPNIKDTDKALIIKNITVINQLENALKPSIFDITGIEKYIDKNKLLSNDVYQNYKKIPIGIKESILECINCLDGFLDLYNDIELPNINLNNKELVDLSYKFFKWLPTKNKEYEKLFLRYSNPNNHLLKFDKNKDDILGSTYFLYYPIFKPYFCINRNGTIEDFCTLNHEISHGIFFSKDNGYSNDYSIYTNELEGHFFDFLSIQFLKEVLDSKQIDELLYSNFITQYYNIINFYITDFCINLYESNKDISILPIKKNILERNLNFYINESILIDSLSQNPCVTSKYLFSYLISLDLENIYDFDPEYAFYLFEQIRTNKDRHKFKILRENAISFMDDGYESFQKTIKKINDLGGKYSK